MTVSEAWLRRFWQGSCDGRVYDCEEFYPLHGLAPRDGVVNYTRAQAYLEGYKIDSWLGRLVLKSRAWFQ